jgi:membrane protein YqaA with SNARE-associated domain
LPSSWPSHADQGRGNRHGEGQRSPSPFLGGTGVAASAAGYKKGTFRGKWRAQAHVCIMKIMVDRPKGEEACSPTAADKVNRSRRSIRLAYIIGIGGLVVTILMIVAIVYFKDDIARLKTYGYLGAFIISLLGGATIIIPVPMLAVVFALGGVMTSPWQVALLGLSAAAGEVIGALGIYMTGHGAGRAIMNSKHGRIQATYERILNLMERRGPIVLFALASVINPFFYPAALACGVLRFGLKRYIPIVLAGKTIKCMTVVYAGYFGLKGLFHAIGIDF